MDNGNGVLELFSDAAKKMIAAIDQTELSSLEDLIRAQEATDKSHKLHAILTSWAIQNSEERQLRKLYAVCFAIMLTIQIASMNIVFLLVGFQILAITETQFNVFFVSMFGEIIALVLIVTKYLFRKEGDTNFIDIIKDL